jgi:hypothetical protein
VHVMVAWEIKDAASDRATEISSALREVLRGYSWVRALGSVYIVKVESEADRNDIGESLKGVARDLGGVN